MNELVFTTVSLLKKAFKHRERSLSQEEIVQRLMKITQNPGYDAEKAIQIALNYPQSPFRKGNSQAIIEYVQEVSAFSNYVFILLSRTGQPLNEEKIMRHLRSQGLISWNFPFVRLGLHADHRFLQLEVDGKWCLHSWELVNDQVAEYLLAEKVQQLTMGQALHIIRTKLKVPEHYCLFVPQADSRFSVTGDKLEFCLVTPPSKEIVNETERIAEKSALEVAVAMTEEQVQVQEQKTVVEEVVQDLFTALIKLEKRADEMKQEVLQFFSTNDLGSIEHLIQEKNKNEQVLLKLQQLVNEIA